MPSTPICTPACVPTSTLMAPSIGHRTYSASSQRANRLNQTAFRMGLLVKRTQPQVSKLAKVRGPLIVIRRDPYTARSLLDILVHDQCAVDIRDQVVANGDDRNPVGCFIVLEDGIIQVVQRYANTRFGPNLPHAI